MSHSFREDRVDLGTISERRKVMKEILAMEAEELGTQPPPIMQRKLQAHQQRAHDQRVSRAKNAPRVTHDFLRTKKSLRGKQERSLDDLFNPAEGQDPDTFWLYQSAKVTQTTLEGKVSGDLRKTKVFHAIRRKIDAMMVEAAKRPKCAVLFDLISTSKIISSSIPHAIGNHIYDYIDTNHYNKTSVKFVFVGITDNVNCCAARDVFCRDVSLGDNKRAFEALDNVHMFTVFPGVHRKPTSWGASGDSQNLHGSFSGNFSPSMSLNTSQVDPTPRMGGSGGFGTSSGSVRPSTSSGAFPAPAGLRSPQPAAPLRAASSQGARMPLLASPNAALKRNQSVTFITQNE